MISYQSRKKRTFVLHFEGFKGTETDPSVRYDAKDGGSESFVEGSGLFLPPHFGKHLADGAVHVPLSDGHPGSGQVQGVRE